jgi:glutaredoxin
MSDEKIKIFTLLNCSHCTSLMDKLTELEIPFEEYEINENRELWNKVIVQTGNNIIPTIFIKTDEEGTGYVFIHSD